ncbi:hypothetical protein DH2020_013835 [Rehmannia glutinosa]|uniref:AIG1-type G domain-containing protein n=1 Tax=Rehmannia glutinosa TaxID=99300 RepID=A0ABR0X4Q6_REHGL
MESKEATSNPITEAAASGSSNTSPLVSNETIGLSDNNDYNSRGNVSEDEGYVSGYEEFEAELNKPVLDETVEESSDASGKIEQLPISGVVVSDDVGVGEGGKDIGGDEKVVGKDSGDGNEAKSSGVEGFDREGEIIESVEKLGVDSNEGVVEGGEIVANSVGDEVSEPEVKEVYEVAVDEKEESKLIDTGDVKAMPEEDSVVDTIQVDVAVAAPGVAVVGETEENGDSVSKPVEEAAVVESEKLEVVDVGLASEGDSVVGTDQVDASDHGVAVVGETGENGVAENKLEPKEVAEDLGDVSLTPEGDAVVDTIQVDVAGPGVAVVGEMEQNEGEKIEQVEIPLELVGESGVNVEEEVSTREVGVDSESAELAAENTGDVVEAEPLQPEHDVAGDEKDENLDMEVGVKKPEVEHESALISEAIENGITAKIHTDVEVNDISNAETVQNNGEHTAVHAHGLSDGVSEAKPVHDPEEIREVEDEMDEIPPEDSMSDEEDTDGMIFGSSEAAKKFIEELERKSGGDSHTALLKAATGADSNGGNITITSQDGSRLFSVERPAGLGSSLQSLRPAARTNRPTLFSNLTPAGGGESEENLSEEEKKKLEKLQQIRVKFLRLVHRLGLSPEESVAAQVLYRLALLGGRQGTQIFSLDAAKRTALQLEEGESDDLDFSVNILVLGKPGVGKSATINSVFGEEKAPIDAFEIGTASVKEISGLVDGVKVRVVDTPGLKPSVVEQGINRSILSSVKKLTKKNPPDVVLYVDRLDAQSRDLNDLPMLKTVTSVLGSSIWRSAIVTLTHSASAPPDGPSGTPLSYEVFVSQRSHVVQQSIGHAVGDLRMMSPSLMNPVSLVENHPSCRKNREGQKILPNGQSWRPQLLLLCYSMKILSEAGSISKPQDPFDHRKLFGFRARAPPLPYMLSSMLQSRTHPKLPSDQGGENADSDIDLDDLSDSDQEEEDEYDQLPPFKPLRKAQIAKLSREQRKAYFEEYDYRVKLLQKKQWREELRRMREFKKKGKDISTDYGFAEDEADAGCSAGGYTHGWDHDCGYDGVNLEHSLPILNRFPAVYTVQITKDKKDFSISLDSSVSAKYGENISSMAGFDIQSMGKQLAYIVRGETKFKNLKKNRTTGGISLTFLGENVVPAVKIEDQVTLGKQYTLVGSAGAVRSQQDTAYGANFELQRRENEYPIGQVQSTLSMSVIKWRGDLALGFNGLAQFAVGRNSKVAVRAGINNKMSGQITVRTSSSEHLSLALAAVIPTALSIYHKLFPAAGEKLLAAFGDSSSDSDGESSHDRRGRRVRVNDSSDEIARPLSIFGDTHTWEPITEINGLWICRGFLSADQQSSLLSALQKEGYLADASHNQAMRFGDLPPWANELSYIICENVLLGGFSSESMNLMTSDNGKKSCLFPAELLRREPLFDQFIVNIYQPGEGICAHVDLLRFEDGIAIISLESSCVMHFSSVAEANHHLEEVNKEFVPSAKIPVLLTPGSLILMTRNRPEEKDVRHPEEAVSNRMKPSGVDMQLPDRRTEPRAIPVKLELTEGAGAGFQESRKQRPAKAQL